MSDGDDKGGTGDGGLAAATLMTQMMTQGVGCIRVKDGQMFMFSEEVLTKLLAAASASPNKQTIVFVKQGPDASKVVV